VKDPNSAKDTVSMVLLAASKATMLSGFRNMSFKGNLGLGPATKTLFREGNQGFRTKSL
jgi:hypothetical protein